MAIPRAMGINITSGLIHSPCWAFNFLHLGSDHNLSFVYGTEPVCMCVCVMCGLSSYMDGHWTSDLYHGHHLGTPLGPDAGSGFTYMITQTRLHPPKSALQLHWAFCHLSFNPAHRLGASN